METKNREKTLLIAVVACLGLLALNSWVIGPLTDSWDARQKHIVDLQKQIEKGKLLQRHAASIEDRWNHMKTNALPSNTTLAEGRLYRSFEGWAQSSGIVLVGQRPQSKDSDDTEYSNEEWRADATGSMQQIMRFLFDMESSPIGLKVDAIELSSRDDSGRQLALGLTVSGLILNPPSPTNSTPSAP